MMSREHGGKERIDNLLVRRGLAESRSKARAMIMAGMVEANGIIVDKPGQQVFENADVSLKRLYSPYVSRGGLKLAAALDFFSVDVKGKVLLDAGASTGGFTDCLLQRGSKRIIAVDVGYGQFHYRLRHDPRVMLLEKTNIRYLKPEDIQIPLDGAVIDVSFISLRLVAPAVSDLLGRPAFMLPLIKPQFEVEKGKVGKGGVVRDPSLHQDIIRGLGRFFEDLGWQVMGHMASPLLGPKGNREFFMYMKR